MKFNRKIFNREITDFYGKHLRRQITQDVISNLDDLLFMSEMDTEWKYPSELAYFFATIGWETAWTFAPVVERRASSNQTDIIRMQERYWSSGYYGRGYVQLTWKDNYKKMGRVVGVDLVKKPDELLKPSVSYEVAAVGMRKGLFRSRSNGKPIKLSDFINKDSVDFIGARDIINGDLSKNGVAIANVAKAIYTILKKALIIVPASAENNNNVSDVVSNQDSASNGTSESGILDAEPYTDGTATDFDNNSPWSPPIKIEPTTPVSTSGPKSIVTVLSTVVSSLGITGSAILSYVSGLLPNLNPTVLVIGCLVCMAIVASVYLISRIYIKNARENRAALLDMQRVEIASDPNKANVECQASTK